MTTLSIDFETRSVVDLRETGVYPYAEHESTEILCMAWAFDDEPAAIYVPGRDVFPLRIWDHLLDGEVRAWNAQFERVMWRDCGMRRYGWPEVKLEQWVCTAAEAAAMSLPRSLGECARVTGVEMQKDEAGHRLMMQMCKPRSRKGGEIVWWDDPKRLERLYAYCQRDVETERALARVLRRLSPAEREVYLLDQRVNDRGIGLDVGLARAAKAIAVAGLDRADTEIQAVTAGAVAGVTKVGQLGAWVRAQGVATDSVDAGAIAALTADAETPEHVKAALTIRAEAARSSVAKIDAMLAAKCSDDRLRGLLLYHGASTGRWTGRLVQPQNFPRGMVGDNAEQYIPAVLARDYTLLDCCAPPLAIVASLLRAMLVARPGHRFLSADFSGIEFRVLNWLAGQDDILDIVRSGRDVYKVNAARMFGSTYETVTKQQRQGGKAVELGCGFGMGHKKFVTTAKDQYGLDLSLTEAKAFVDYYRASHGRVVQFWYDLDGAARRAVAAPGGVEHAGPIRFTYRGAYLWCILPSGRPLCYAAPRIVDRETPWGEVRPAVECWAVNSQTRQWEAFTAYGGLWAENVTQAVARDIMAEAMLRVEAAGYPVVLSVHDEIVAERPMDDGSLAEFETLMRQPPAWAATCPITTEGWTGQRYRK